MEVINLNKFDRKRRLAASVKQMYPPGTRIELICMNDPYSPVPSGTRGTVRAVADMGTIFPDWDNGRSLLVESVTGKQLVVMGNFTHNAVDVAFPATAGNWTNYFTGKSETINTQVNVPAHGYVVYTNF